MKNNLIRIGLILTSALIGGCSGGETSPKNAPSQEDSKAKLLVSWRTFVGLSKQRSRSDEVTEWGKKNGFTPDITFLSDDLVKSASIQHPVEGVINLRFRQNYGSNSTSEYEYELRFAEINGKWSIVGGTGKNTKKGETFNVTSKEQLTGGSYLLRQVFDL